MIIFLYLFQLIIFISLFPLHASPPFRFEDADQEGLNRWVAATGAEIYKELNNDSKFGYPRGNMYCTPSKHWKAYSPYLEPSVYFVKKRGVPASKALKSLLAEGGGFDCRIAQEIIFLECMRKLIGDEQFYCVTQNFEKENAEFFNARGDRARKELWLGSRTESNPYFRFTSMENGSLHRLNKIGYFGYTPNIAEYGQIHPQGFLRGDNGLLCKAENEEVYLYTGYGDFYQNGGRKWEEMVARFKEETLTLLIPNEIDIDATHIPQARRTKYIQMRQ